MANIITTKKKFLIDRPEHRYGFSCNDTRVRVVDSETGEVIFEDKNKIIFPGSCFTARSHFDFGSAGYADVVPSYNTLMGLEGLSSDNPAAGQIVTEKAFLFCVGTDGCGPEAAQRYPVDYTKAMLPRDLVTDISLGYMIPFKFRTTNNDLSGAERDKYFGKRIENLSNTAAKCYAYYFKTFESDPKLIREFTDNTTITADTNLYYSTKTAEAQCYVELRLKITKDDFREYFSATVGINEAKWNSLSLCTGWKTTYTDKSGVEWPCYQNIRPMTKLHIPNESLIDTSKEYDIIYHIYY